MSAKVQVVSIPLFFNYWDCLHPHKLETAIDPSVRSKHLRMLRGRKLINSFYIPPLESH